MKGVTEPSVYKELFAKREVRCTTGLLTRLSAFTPGQVSSSPGYEFNWCACACARCFFNRG
jgi:hypothetical protein